MRRVSQHYGLAVISILLGLAAAGCEPGGAPPYRKAGADSAQLERDWSDCRSKVNAFLAKDRGIDADRQAAMGGGGPPGSGGVRRQMDASSDDRRAGRLTRECMQNKGYSGGEPDRGGIRW